MENTLILIKPDGIQRRLVGEILGRFEAKGLQIVGMKMIRVTKELAERHYAAHKGKPFYPGLIAYISSSPVIGLVLRGKNAITVTRSLMGATFGSKAVAGTIRGDLAISDGLNLVHGSDSPQAAAEEISLYFRPEELHQQAPADLSWVYDCSGGSPV